MTEILCAICKRPDRPVDINSRYTYELHQAWGRRGKAGGSDMVNRRGLGVFAHPDCVDLEKNGVHPGQGTLK
jgi:hypothetical protein